MEYIRLGDTDLQVSRLAFGTLTMGPLQANLSVEDGASLLVKAGEAGINFLDTADLYDNYPQIKEGLRRSTKEWIVASKSYDYTWEGMKSSVEKARKGLDRDVIDLWMLHETESIHTIQGHREALDFLLEEKEKGRIGHVGVSTHHIAGVRGALAMDEIEVAHPIFNMKGLGIADGTREEMEEALIELHNKGKGIFAMKPLGGGNLIQDRKEAFGFVLDKDYIHAVAVGMQSPEEVEYNVALVEGREINIELEKSTIGRNRHLHIDSWCQGCGRCAEICSHKALGVQKGQMKVDGDKCVLCGYCAAVCPQFCIKVV